MKKITFAFLLLTILLAVFTGVLSDLTGTSTDGTCAALGCLAFLFGVLTILSATDAWENV